MKFLYNSLVYYTKLSFGFLTYWKADTNISNPTQIDEAEWNSAYDEYTLSKINDTRFGY